jgi:hypothetical protein
VIDNGLALGLSRKLLARRLELPAAVGSLAVCLPQRLVGR